MTEQQALKVPDIHVIHVISRARGDLSALKLFCAETSRRGMVSTLRGCIPDEQCEEIRRLAGPLSDMLNGIAAELNKRTSS